MTSQRHSDINSEGNRTENLWFLPKNKKKKMGWKQNWLFSKSQLFGIIFIRILRRIALSSLVSNSRYYRRCLTIWK